MRHEQAEQLAGAVKSSRWVDRVAVRPNEKANGGYCLSVWPKDDARGTRELAWTETRMQFHRLFPGEKLPTRNRDLAVERENQSLRSLW